MRSSNQLHSYFWPPNARQDRQGAIIVLGSFLIIMFCGFAAFAIDLGYIALTQAQLQNAADAAALAGVLELKDAGGDTRDVLRQRALDEALKAAAFNTAAGRSVVVDPGEVAFGNRHYDSDQSKFVTLWEPDPDLNQLPLNAIKVDVSYSETAGPRAQLNLMFARLINHDKASVSGASKAHLTPRDLAFVIDISNSMNDDTEANSALRYDMLRAWFGLDTSISLTSSLTYTVGVLNQTQSSGQRSITNASSSGGQFLLTSSNHGLVTGDVVRLVRTGGADSNFSNAVQGAWRVTVVSASQYILNGSSYAGPFTTGVVGFGKGVYPNPWGNIRVRTRLPHGLNTGVQIRLYGVQGVANAGGTTGQLFRVARLDDSRFDLLTTGGTPVAFNNSGSALGNWANGHHVDGTGTMALAPDLVYANDDDYKAAWLRTLDSNGPNSGGVNIWSTSDLAERVAAEEFPSGQTDPNFVSGGPEPMYYGAPGDFPTLRSDGAPYAYPKGHPWKHWKWKAFCDWVLYDGDNSDFPGDQRAHERNLNVLASSNTSSFSYNNYAVFCMLNGYVPAMRGQQMAGRDMDTNGTLDTFPSVLGTRFPGSYGDYPSFAGFYSKGTYVENYDWTVIDFTEGSPVAGLHPQNVPDMPFTFVRQATLLGIHAMISDENVGNDAFDQVGMVTYGTRANIELDLTNDLPEALRRTNCRCVVTGSNLNITPAGNGNTNIGGAIRAAIDLVKFSPRSRSFTNKTIALLTDGQPNISPQGGYTAPEFSNPNGPDTFSNGVSGGDGYARYWAGQAESEGIIVHTIGVGVGATTGSAGVLLQDCAEMTGGQYFPISDPATQQETLNNIFIAIGKDKLGKLFN